MSRFVLRDVIGWGFGLWLFGYILGFLLFGIVPTALIGWVIFPFGLLATCAVLNYRVRLSSVSKAIYVGLGWTMIAVVCDYVFLVKLLNPADGYYKLDVYLYYGFTLFLPIGFALLRAPKR